VPTAATKKVMEYDQLNHITRILTGNTRLAVKNPKEAISFFRNTVKVMRISRSELGVA
jgi:hypothetical protein